MIRRSIVLPALLLAACPDSGDSDDGNDTGSGTADDTADDTADGTAGGTIGSDRRLPPGRRGQTVGSAASCRSSSGPSMCRSNRSCPPLSYLRKSGTPAWKTK